MRPGTQFCAACGAKMPAPEPKPFLDTDPVPGAEKRKRPRGRRARRIVLLVLAALIVAAGAVFHRLIGEFLLRTFLSPAKYYQHVEARAIEDLAARFGDCYVTYLVPEDGMTGSAVELHVSPATEALDWLEDATLRTTVQTENGAAMAHAELLLNDAQLLAANCYSDSESAALQIPLLNEDYFELEDVSGGSLALSDALRDADLTRDEAEALMKKLLTCVVQELDDVTKDRDTLSAGGISQRCTVLRVTIREEDAAEIRAALRELLQTDADAQALLTALADAADTDAGSIIRAFTEDILASVTDGETAQMDLSVAANGDVIGRADAMPDDTAFSYARPISAAKKTMGLEARLRAADATEITVTGELQRERGTLTCAAAIDGDTDDVFTLEYSDLETAGDARSAHFKLELDKGVVLLFGKNQVTKLLRSVDAEGDCTLDGRKTNATFDLRYLHTDAATVSIAAAPTESAPFTPVTDAVSFKEWQRSGHYISAIKELTDALRQAGVPQDVLRQLLLQLPELLQTSDAA